MTPEQRQNISSLLLVMRNKARAFGLFIDNEDREMVLRLSNEADGAYVAVEAAIDEATKDRL